MPTCERTARPLRVLIIDQHEVSRAAIRALLRTEGLEVVADVASVDEALLLGDAIAPDVAVLDIRAQTGEAVDAARALARLRSTPTVVLTSSAALNFDLDGFAFVPKSEICARQLRLAVRPDRRTHP